MAGNQSGSGAVGTGGSTGLQLTPPSWADDQPWKRAAIIEMNAKAKPVGSLGLLEIWAIK